LAPYRRIENFSRDRADKAPTGGLLILPIRPRSASARSNSSTSRRSISSICAANFRCSCARLPPLIPGTAAPFHNLTRAASAAVAASTVPARSISSTSAELPPRASANPPSTDTCPGCENAETDRDGSSVTRRTRLASAGNSPRVDLRARSRPCARSDREIPGAFAMSARRSPVDVGAARKIVSRRANTS